jgi:thioredoxin
MATPIEVTDADFQERVLDRSAELPVLVDFWADWCRPCHMLAPVIEAAIDAHPGKIELAKLDTEANRTTPARYGIRGLPTVKAFRDGRVVDEFTGAQPPLVVERFVDGLVPSEADELAGCCCAAATPGTRSRCSTGSPGTSRQKGWPPAHDSAPPATSSHPPSTPGTPATTRPRWSASRPRSPIPSGATTCAG